MEKRSILAIALSLLVLLSWSTFVSKSYRIDNKGVTEKAPEPLAAISSKTKTRTPGPGLVPEASVLPYIPAPSFNLSLGKFEVVFNEPQAAIKELVYNNYQSYKFPLQYGFLLKDTEPLFKKESVTDNSATFVYNDGNKKIIKRFIFDDSDYSMELEIEIENLLTVSNRIILPLTLGILDFSQSHMQSRFQDVTATQVHEDKINHFNARKETQLEDIKFLGLRERYFCAIVEPDSEGYSGFIKKLNRQESEIGLSSKEFTLYPGQRIVERFRIYLGPQELKLISRVNPEWTSVMYFGMFDFIAHLLLRFLDGLYRMTKNWGVVVILLSMAIYLLLFPLTLKQMRSMKHMQALHPAIEEIRKTYKDNPQKMNKEIMGLYREHKVNPLSGCLPLVLQIPIFFSLYNVLMRSVALKGANFLWIKDLSAPDRLFTLPVSLPVLGNEFNLLPILMTIGMFFQQKLSMGTSSGGSTEQQKLMTTVFPLMFGFIFYRMPAGLVLYWFTNSLFTTVYQFRVNRAK